MPKVVVIVFVFLLAEIILVSSISSLFSFSKDFFEDRKTRELLLYGEYIEGTENEIRDTLMCIAPDKRLDYALNLMAIYEPSDKQIYDHEAPRKEELLARMKAGSITVKEEREFHQEAFASTTAGISSHGQNFTAVKCSRDDCYSRFVNALNNSPNILVMRTGYADWRLGYDDLDHHYYSLSKSERMEEVARLRVREEKRRELQKRADEYVDNLKPSDLSGFVAEGKALGLFHRSICAEMY